MWNNYSNDWYKYSKKEYSYDVNNNLILEEYFIWTGGEWINNHYYHFDYDSNNNIILREEYVWNDTTNQWEGINSKSIGSFESNHNRIL